MKIDISWKKFKSFFQSRWINFRDRKKIAARKKLSQDIADWYPSNVKKVILTHLRELGFERVNKISMKVMYRCPSCNETFMDYRTLSDSSTIECNKCVFGEAHHLVTFAQKKKEPKKIAFTECTRCTQTIEDGFRVERFYQDKKLIKEVRIPIEPNKFNDDGKLCKDG